MTNVAKIVRSGILIHRDCLRINRDVQMRDLDLDDVEEMKKTDTGGRKIVYVLPDVLDWEKHIKDNKIVKSSGITLSIVDAQHYVMKRRDLQEYFESDILSGISINKNDCLDALNFCVWQNKSIKKETFGNILKYVSIGLNEFENGKFVGKREDWIQQNFNAFVLKAGTIDYYCKIIKRFNNEQLDLIEKYNFKQKEIRLILKGEITFDDVLERKINHKIEEEDDNDNENIEREGQSDVDNTEKQAVISLSVVFGNNKDLKRIIIDNSKFLKELELIISKIDTDIETLEDNVSYLPSFKYGEYLKSKKSINKNVKIIKDSYIKMSDIINKIINDTTLTHDEENQITKYKKDDNNNINDDDN